MKISQTISTCAIIFIIMIVQSCGTKRNEEHKISDVSYDSYSITLFQIDDSQVYLRLKGDRDSLLIIKDKDSTNKVRRNILFDKAECVRFKQVVIENLSEKKAPDTTMNVFGGVAVKFYIEKNNWNLSAKFSRLAGFYTVSKDFEDYLHELQTKVSEIYAPNDKNQIDSVQNLMKSN